jgi:hypothetical protein
MDKRAEFDELEMYLYTLLHNITIGVQISTNRGHRTHPVTSQRLGVVSVSSSCYCVIQILGVRCVPPDASGQWNRSLEPLCWWPDAGAPEFGQYLASVRSSLNTEPWLLQLQSHVWSISCASVRWSLNPSCAPLNHTGLYAAASSQCTNSVRCYIPHSIHFQFKFLCEWGWLQLIFELPSAKFDKCAPHLTH